MICISLPILVVIAGIYLLAKTKTDNLGTGFKFAAYASILAGLIMVGMSMMMCMSNCCDKKGGHGHEYHQSCKGHGHDGCSGASSCSQSSKCSKGDKCCKKGADKCSKDSKSCSKDSKSCSKEAKSCSKDQKSCTNKCDISKCSKMNKEECAKMCDEKGCSAEEKEWCLSHFDDDGNWIGCKEDASSCTKSKKTCTKGSDKVAQL
jgi:hypothetical protein